MRKLDDQIYLLLKFERFHRNGKLDMTVIEEKDICGELLILAKTGFTVDGTTFMTIEYKVSKEAEA